MKPVFGTIILAALVSPAVAAAQLPPEAPSTTDERRLTPEQVEAVLAEAAAKQAATQGQIRSELPAAEDDEGSLIPPVHGEVGFSVGTGGYREVFGTGIYPLGPDGTAIISLDFVDWGRRPY